jgi:predicted nucleic acid-binding protein
MPTQKILVDSGFLYALYDRNDPDHEEAAAVADLYSGQFIIPYVVLTEAAYLSISPRRRSKSGCSIP